MASTRGRATVGVLVLAILVGGVSGWSLRGGGGAGAGDRADRPSGRATPAASGAGGAQAWIEGTVREGGEDFVLLDVPGGSRQNRIVRIEHVRWKTTPGVRLVVPPPRGMQICARVVLGLRGVRSGTFRAGTAFEGACCSPRAAG
jgi:hypothetical protein